MKEKYFEKDYAIVEGDFELTLSLCKNILTEFAKENPGMLISHIYGKMAKEKGYIEKHELKALEGAICDLVDCLRENYDYYKKASHITFRKYCNSISLSFMKKTEHTASGDGLTFIVVSRDEYSYITSTIEAMDIPAAVKKEYLRINEEYDWTYNRENNNINELKTFLKDELKDLAEDVFSELAREHGLLTFGGLRKNNVGRMLIDEMKERMYIKELADLFKEEYLEENKMQLLLEGEVIFKVELEEVCYYRMKF